MNKVKKLEKKIAELESALATYRKNTSVLNLASINAVGAGDCVIIEGKDFAGRKWHLFSIYSDGCFYRHKGISHDSKWQLDIEGRIKEGRLK